MTPLEEEEDRLITLCLPTKAPTPNVSDPRSRPLWFVLSSLQACSSRDDGVIPGVLAYAAGADWPGLEFLLLRDSRHAIT